MPGMIERIESVRVFAFEKACFIAEGTAQASLLVALKHGGGTNR